GPHYHLWWPPGKLCSCPGITPCYSRRTPDRGCRTKSTAFPATPETPFHPRNPGCRFDVVYPAGHLRTSSEGEHVLCGQWRNYRLVFALCHGFAYFPAAYYQR